MALCSILRISVALWISCTFGFTQCAAAGPNQENVLRANLLRGYKTVVPPSETTNIPVGVSVGLELFTFSLEELTSEMRINTALLVTWHDPKLSWEPQSNGNITSLTIPEYKIWKPTMNLYNRRQYYDTLRNNWKTTRYTTKINYHGIVFWVPILNFKTTCTLDMTLWPFDSQVCDITLCSYSVETYDVQLKVWRRTVDLYAYQANKEWTLTNVTASEHTKCGDKAGVNFRMHLKRNSSSYAATIVVPGLVIAVVSLSMFWLPALSTERIVYGLVSFFAALSYMQYIGSIIPNNGNDSPYVALFFRECIILICSSIVLTVVFRYMLYSLDDCNAQFLQLVRSETLAKVLLLPHEEKLKVSVLVDHVLNRLIYVIYLIAYVTCALLYI